MNAVGAYIYAGGFTLGMEKHFNVMAHVQECNFGVKTFNAARPEIPVYTFDDRPKMSEVDVVYSNPPCSAWSSLGPRIQRGADIFKTDARIACVEKSFNLFEELGAYMWVWESVPRLLSGGRDVLDSYVERALAKGYSVTVVKVDAADLGARQRRKRVFVVAHLHDISWFTTNSSHIPISEALAEFNSMYPGVPQTLVNMNQPYEFLRRVKQGEALRDAYDRLQGTPYVKDARKRGFACRRTKASRICPTIAGSYDLVHPTQHRFLSIEELLWLSHYPIDYPLFGGMEAKGNLIARGVLPIVGDWLGQKLSAALRRNEWVDPEFNLVENIHEA